jgi:hypothetical protein
MGHSMGGGASFLAAESNPTIHTLINFAAAETNPSAISAAVNISTPTLIFSGDDDCVAPPEQNQNRMYDGLSSDCKTHIRIRSGGHCYFANYEFHCTSGESICNPTLDITREEQQSATFDFLKLWLQYALYDDHTAFSIFNDSLQFSTRINYSQFCNTTGIRGPIDNSEIRVFPIPVKDKLNLELTERTSGGLLVLYNIMGIKVFQTSVHTCNSQINLSNLPHGIYFIVYLKGSCTYSTKIIKTQIK